MIKKQELRKKVIEDKIKDIIDSIMLVEENLPKEIQEFLGSGIIKDGIYKRIEFAVQNILDICNIINADLRLGTPQTEDDIIENLEKQNIFEKKIANLIKEMKGFRNVLAHKYGRLNDEQAYANITEGLKDFEIVINALEKFLKRC